MAISHTLSAVGQTCRILLDGEDLFGLLSVSGTFVGEVDLRRVHGSPGSASSTVVKTFTGPDSITLDRRHAEEYYVIVRSLTSGSVDVNWVPEVPVTTTGGTGATGPAGPQGIQGVQGVAGPIGLTGPQGLAGVDGVDGAQGLQGIQGVAGPAGVAGPQGLPGVDGADGADATFDATGFAAPGAENDVGINTGDATFQSVIDKVEAYVASTAGDNLGDHTATQNVDVAGFQLNNWGLAQNSVSANTTIDHNNSGEVLQFNGAGPFTVTTNENTGAAAMAIVRVLNNSASPLTIAAGTASLTGDTSVPVGGQAVILTTTDAAFADAGGAASDTLYTADGSLTGTRNVDGAIVAFPGNGFGLSFTNLGSWSAGVIGGPGNTADMSLATAGGFAVDYQVGPGTTNVRANGSGAELTANSTAGGVGDESLFVHPIDGIRLDSASQSYGLGDGAGARLPADVVAETTKALVIDQATGKLLQAPASVASAFTQTFVAGDWTLNTVASLSNLATGTFGTINAQNVERFQSFTAPGSGDIPDIDLNLQNSSGGTQTAQVTLYDGAGIGGTVLAQGTVTVIGGGEVTYNVTFATPAAVVNGQVYTVGVVRVGASTDSLGWHHTGGVDVFPGFDLSNGLVGVTDGKMSVVIVPTGASGGDLTIPAATHGLGVGFKHVTVFDAANDILVISPNVDPATGDVTLSTNGATFDGAVYIS